MPTKTRQEDDSSCMVKISFGYSANFIFPYDQGIALMNCFKYAEEWDRSNQVAKIKPLENSPEMTIISRAQYQETKMNALLKDDE